MARRSSQFLGQPLLVGLVYLLVAGIANCGQLPIVSIQYFVVTELYNKNVSCDGNFLKNDNSNTVAAVEVPNGTNNDVQLVTAPRPHRAPVALSNKQTFQFTAYGVGAALAPGLAPNVSVAYQVKNLVSNKCWVDHGGVMGSPLFQTTCVSALSESLTGEGRQQFFVLLPQGPGLGCTNADTIYLIQSLESLILNTASGIVRGNCVTSVYPGLKCTMYVCDPNAPNERYLLSAKELE